MLPSARQAGWLSAGLPLLALSIALAACGGKTAQTPALADSSLRPDRQADIIVPAGKPIVIGVSVPLSGPDSSAGGEDRDAVITGVNRWKERNGGTIDGHEIVVRAEDDGCTEADITVQAAERLLRTEGLVGVIGPNCSAGAEAAIPVYRDAGIVAISGSVTRTDLTASEDGSGFFFRTAYRNDLQGTLIGLFARATLRGKAAYLIDDDEEYGLDLADAAQHAMEASDVQITRETIERGTVDFTALAERIARDNPSFVGFAGFNPEAALLYRQLRDAGYAGTFGAGDAAASLRDFVEPVGASEAEGVVFSGCPLDLPADFVGSYTRVHGSAPEASVFVGQYADAATVLLAAVAAVAQEQPDGSLVIDPGDLRDAVAAADLPDGISGAIAFDTNGDRVPERGASVAEVTNTAIQTADLQVFVRLGLVPCQVHDGKLVNPLEAIESGP